MFQNVLKVALRNLRKRLGYTAINVAGLAVGIACCLLIGLWVLDETSYDRFHPDADRLYRVVIDGVVNGRALNAPVTPTPMAPVLPQEFPEVEAAARLFDLTSGTLVRRDEARQFLEERFRFADTSFFRVFRMPFLEGDPATALAEPNSVVLTRAMAEKYFPGERALGQHLTVTDTTLYRVTGVVEVFPANAHFHFDFLATMAGLPQFAGDFWIANNLRTYVLLRPGADPGAVSDKFEGLMRKYAGAQFQQFGGQSYDDFLASGNRIDYVLQPVPDIHLHSHLEFEMEPNGSLAFVYIFACVAGFILLIACINFMNLATARAAGRAKEVGVRKVMGSNRALLVRQFLLESVLLSLFAMAVAAGIVALALPAFNGLTGKAISYGFFLDPAVLLALLGLGLGVGVLAGSYPAFFLSAFQPVAVLKGAFQRGGAGGHLRSGLVVFQFAISIALIVSTVVVYDQLEFIREKELGFDQEHVVVVKRAGFLGEQANAFKEEVRALPGVVSVGATTSVPGGIFGQTPLRPEGAGPNDDFLVSPVAVDYDYFAAMGIEIAEGRPFSRDFATDTSAFVLNEAAVRKLGWEEPVGRRLRFVGDTTGTMQPVVGVVRDFHVASLHDPIGPIAMTLSDDGALPNVVVRVRPDNLSGTLAALEETWREFLPGQPFAYSFLDEDFAALYQADQRLGSIFRVFAGVAILIACLGLFGLASYTTQQRTKEIGVRKVLGASVLGIVALLSKDFLRLVGIAFVVGALVAGFAMDRWLADFAYRVALGPVVFAVAGLIALLIAVATVSGQALRAATSDPVKALRYE